MAIFKSAPHPSQDPSSSLRLPAAKRISASQRLSTILESSRALPAPTVPLRSNLRPKYKSVPMTQHPVLRRSLDTQRTGPPAYDYLGSSIAESEDLNAPIEGEKLAQLRRGGNRKSRGGWNRCLIILVIVLVIIGLAVGLGVGLTVGRRSSSTEDNSTASSSSSSGSSTGEQSTLSFPIGEYSFVTALRTEQTNCTSIAATWRCYPYVTFATDNATSLATFNWIISNTSASYALQSTGATGNDGIPANLSISSATNPFAITFSNESLTYISESGNSSSARYSFNFTMPKVVVPSPAITSNNEASECFFNSTVFVGNLYLNSSRTYPNAALQSSTSIGGYEQWAYAVEISQVSPGGTGVPDCYETVNGVIGDRIVNVLTAEPDTSQCVCDYRNF